MLTGNFDGYLVGQRTKEIGVRRALGAQKLDVLRMVLKDGARMTLIGIGLGLVGAARDTAAIERYVGRIAGQLASSVLDKALLVEAYEPGKPDPRLAIWDLPEAGVLHFPKAGLGSCGLRAYRRAYLGAFPNVNLTGLVLDHVLNRRVARLKGFGYLRIVPISRGTNSSHGSLSEGWGVEYHSSPERRVEHLVPKQVFRFF